MTWEDEQKLFKSRKDKDQDERETTQIETAALEENQIGHSPDTQYYSGRDESDNDPESMVSLKRNNIKEG